MTKVKPKKLKTRPYDSAEYLDTPEAIAEYLTGALETADAAFIAKAIGVAARAKGMSEVARLAGVSRENLYRSLDGETKPELGTIISVLTALGVQLAAKPAA
jgi:probable addiction module antidote protein